MNPLDNFHVNLSAAVQTATVGRSEWRPGGYTLGGVPEAMVDKVNLNQGFVIPFYGFAEVMMDRRAGLLEAA